MSATCFMDRVKNVRTIIVTSSVVFALVMGVISSVWAYFAIPQIDKQISLRIEKEVKPLSTKVDEVEKAIRLQTFVLMQQLSSDEIEEAINQFENDEFIRHGGRSD